MNPGRSQDMAFFCDGEHKKSPLAIGDSPPLCNIVSLYCIKILLYNTNMQQDVHP